MIPFILRSMEETKPIYVSFREAVDNIEPSRKFGLIRGIACRYNAYHANGRYHSPFAYLPGCFEDYIFERVPIPVFWDHNEDERVGWCIDMTSTDTMLLFTARIYDIRVFNTTRDKLQFSLAANNRNEDTIRTDEGELITKAMIKEISILLPGSTPAQPWAIEL